jgi:glucans biosynthesis protein
MTPTGGQIEPEALANSPRCLARTRSGTRCRSPAVKGRKRCWTHGGTNKCLPKGNRNAHKHGGYSAETKAKLRYVEELARIVQDANTDTERD